MAKTVYLDDKDRKLLCETKKKLDEATKLMSGLMETLEILSDPKMMQAIEEGKKTLKLEESKSYARF